MGTDTEGSVLAQYRIGFRFASKELAKQLALSYTDYYSALSPANIEYKRNKKGATIDEYKDYAVAQMLEFTDTEKAIITECVHRIEKSFELIGFCWSVEKDIIFVCTTGMHEHLTSAFTHDSHIYISRSFISQSGNSDFFDGVIAHEICHVLTRFDHAFRERLYTAVGFDKEAHEPDFPDEIRNIIVKNPDVDSYDHSAEFTVDGKRVRAVIAIVYSDAYRPGASMMSNHNRVLIPVNSPSEMILMKKAKDIERVIGNNTDYVIAADEVAAENFKCAVMSALGSATRDHARTEAVLAIMRAHKK